jgi:hypothetical protein
VKQRIKLRANQSEKHPYNLHPKLSFPIPSFKDPDTGPAFTNYNPNKLIINKFLETYEK